ncbi:unnamed protein product, partial [Durusdinium trenchii]
NSSTSIPRAPAGSLLNMMLHMTPQKYVTPARYVWLETGERQRSGLPRRIERASMPVRACPRTELLTLRQEVQRMHREAEEVADLKAQVETLKADLRNVLDKNRQMTDLMEQQKCAEDGREQAAQARRSQLACARQLFRAMLDGRRESLQNSCAL